MINKKRLLAVVISFTAMLLSSCSSLLPNMSHKPRSSSNIEESSEKIDSSYKQSSSTKSSTHRHNWSDWYVLYEPTCTNIGQEERRCTECGATQQARIPARGHEWGEWEEIVSASCTEGGIRRRLCVVCHEEEQEYIPPLGHAFNEEDIVWTQVATCEQQGIGEYRCLRCNTMQTLIKPAYGHDPHLIGGETEPEPGKAEVRLYNCSRCGLTYLNFKCDDVTEASKKRLVFGGDYGEHCARFFGRSIGNAQALDANGASINQLNNECVYCSTETGDYFEFLFDLTTEQAAMLETCRLYCDARPADYLSGDFWAYGRGNTDWTPGYYIDGADEHVQHNEDGSIMMVKDHARPVKNEDGSENEGQVINREVKMGARIEEYRYALYVDDQIQQFDPDTEVPVEGSNTNMVRKEYVLPYTFHLHKGQNKISLHMAGGYRSTFYNFSFRPYVEPTPVNVNENKIEVREGKTAQITSPMVDLTYKSSDTSIATVDEKGLVTGVKAGTTTITVSKEGNFKDAKIPVTVLEKEGVITLNLTDGVIAPEDGVTLYNSSSSGQWYRNFRENATVTYTFTSELAGKFDIRLGLRGSNIVLADNFNIKVNGVDVALSGTVNTQYSAVDYVVGQADLKVGGNTMVITALIDNSLYLKTLKFIPQE